MMAQGSGKARGCGCVTAIVGAVLVAALVAAIAFALALMSSAERAKGYISDARSSYEAARTSVMQGDVSAALGSARKALNSVDALDEELSGPLWDVAARLPYLGEDVSMAREMASIAGDLADEAMLPIVDELEPLVDGSSFAQGAVATGERLMALAEAFDRSSDVVFDCEGRANALPESHFKQLNDAAGELRRTVSTTADLLRAFQDALDAIGWGISGLVEKIPI